MKAMTNPEVFFIVHRDSKALNSIKTNMEMRQWISSYGFMADRELADKIFQLRNAAA